MVSLKESISILVALALEACAPTKVSGLRDTMDQNSLIGTVSMPEVGRIVVNYRSGSQPTEPVEIKESEHADAFRGYVEMAGGLQVGEEKPLIAYSGLVRMNEDRSITVSHSGYASGSLNVEPDIKRYEIGTQEYKYYVDKVGGLSPGETKGYRD